MTRGFEINGNAFNFTIVFKIAKSSFQYDSSIGFVFIDLYPIQIICFFIIGSAVISR